MGAYHAANFALRRADLFPLALCLSGNYDPTHLARRGASRATPLYFNNPTAYVANLHGDHLDWLRRQVHLVLVVRAGHVGGHHRRADQHPRASRACSPSKGIPHELDVWGYDVAARLAVVAAPARPPPARDSAEEERRDAETAPHLIGLLLGTEEDWPARVRDDRAAARAGPRRRRRRARTSTSSGSRSSRSTCATKPRYDLVIDRLAYWYYHPREWLKKVALMDDVYLLNSPFTFQSHGEARRLLRDDAPRAARCPDTVLVPFKNPPDNAKWAYTAARYNQPFDLDAIAERIGYPLFMKPYDGGAWVGVTRIKNRDDAARGLRRVRPAADAPAEGGRGLRRRSPGRCPSAPETMVMKFRPELPMHDRYEVAHDFLDARGRRRGRHDLPAGQRVLPVGVQLLRDAGRGHRGAPDRLRQRLPGRRDHLAALLLPVGDDGAGALDGVLRW